MGKMAAAPGMTEYRVVLVQPESHGVLALRSAGSYRLPCVRIPSIGRPAQQLQKAIQAMWGVRAFILDTCAKSDCTSCCAVAELLSPRISSDLEEVSLDQIMSSDLTSDERCECELRLDSESTSPMARVGWIEEALSWVASATGQRIQTKNEIEQMNGRGAFTLVRFQTEGGDYWLKATGEPNAHELPVTASLSGMCGEYLPEFVDSRPEWNAWLMSGQAAAISELPSEPLGLFNLLNDAIESMAELQMRTAGRQQDLLEAGAFDQSLQALAAHSGEMFAFVEEAMILQTSTRARRIEKSRLREITEIFETICERLEVLDLPNTVVHGDMNPGNILTKSGQCKFIDWSEAYVGNPLITFEHLLLFNQGTPSGYRESNAHKLKERYKAKMSKICDPQAIDECLLYSPVLAAYSALYGRGGWLSSPIRNDPRRQAYVRNLARHIDLAARDPQLLDALGVSVRA